MAASANCSPEPCFQRPSGKRILGMERPRGHQAPWFETNPWAAELLHTPGLDYSASEVGDYGCCFVLKLHPWLSGRPSWVRLLEDLVRAMQATGDVWFARGAEIAAWVTAQPGARREIDFDHPSLVKH